MGAEDALDAAEKFENAVDKLLDGLKSIRIDPERVAQMIAHRACCGSEHDAMNGKIHGHCVVCGVPWPCEYVGPLPKEREG